MHLAYDYAIHDTEAADSDTSKPSEFFPEFVPDCGILANLIDRSPKLAFRGGMERANDGRRFVSDDELSYFSDRESCARWKTPRRT